MAWLVLLEDRYIPLDDDYVAFSHSFKAQNHPLDTSPAAL